MHIAYLHYLSAGDTALNHVAQFTAATRSLGHQVDLYGMNLGPAAEGAGDPPALRGRVRAAAKARLSRYLHEPKELWWNVHYVRLESRALGASRPDVMLVRDNLLTASCVEVARRLRLPLVLEVNAPALESRLYLDRYAHLPRIPEILECWKLRRADAVTVVSSPLKEYLVETYGVPPDKVCVVPNGADLDRFHPGQRADDAIAPVKGRGPVIGFVGSFQKWHGTDLLARMLLRVAGARPEVHFLLVGDGPELAAVRQATAALGERVVCTSAVPHERVPGLVASMDIGVLPEADFYRCPLKVIEWLAAGCAVVAPGYAPLRELIDDGVHGMLFEPGDLDGLTAAVLRLVDDEPRRQALAAAAVRRARGRFAWTDNAQRVMATCEAAKQAYVGRHAFAGARPSAPDANRTPGPAC